MSGPRRGSGDGGFATVWVISAMALVVATTIAAIGFGLVVLARHRAANAADEAALAAAAEAVSGPDDACSSARGIAGRNGARLIDCALDGAVATVSVIVALPGPLARFGPAAQRARAGPSSVAEAELHAR